jgi:hypothetical protein
LGGAVRFLAAGVGSARGATPGTTKKAPTGIEASFARQPRAIIQYPGDYFSELFIDVNSPFKFEPRPFTVAMMARLMPAAINPYSIAVAADWSAKNFQNVVFTFPPPGRARSGLLPVREMELEP